MCRSRETAPRWFLVGSINEEEGGKGSRKTCLQPWGLPAPCSLAVCAFYWRTVHGGQLRREPCMRPELVRDYLQGQSKSKTCSVPSRKPGSVSQSQAAQRDQTGRPQLIPESRGVPKRGTQKGDGECPIQGTHMPHRHLDLAPRTTVAIGGTGDLHSVGRVRALWRQSLISKAVEEVKHDATHLGGLA